MLIAYDRDEAGEKAAAALADELTGIGIECYRVLFPKGMDANEYALKVTPAPKSLGVLLNKAQWLGKGKPPEREQTEIRRRSPSRAANRPGRTTQKPIELAAEEPAAKEKIEPVFSLAAEAAAPVDRSSRRSPRTRRSSSPWATAGTVCAACTKNLSYDLLKVNMLASRGDGFHVDTLDLYSARQRAVFVKQAAIEMGVKEEVIRHDLGRVLLKLEEMQDEQIRRALEPKRERS